MACEPSARPAAAPRVQSATDGLDATKPVPLRDCLSRGSEVSSAVLRPPLVCLLCMECLLQSIVTRPLAMGGLHRAAFPCCEG
eukprot:3441724-Prymnesium_polylepis.1